MKRLLILCSLFTMMTTANAQLKVSSNGNVGIKTTGTPLSPLSINTTGDTLYSIYNLSHTGRGIICNVSGNSTDIRYGGYFYTSTSNTSRRVYGIRSYAGMSSYSSSSSPYGYGVVGHAMGANCGIGIMGHIQYCNKGAAIYGSVTNDYGLSIPNNLYAGFFNGDVGMSGNLTVNGSIQGLLLGESSNSHESCVVPLSRETTSLTSKLRGLCAMQFRFKEELSNRTNRDIELEEGEDSIELRDPTIIDKQLYSKQHYALSADIIEEVFPDLVYKQENGKKAINYMEMIPLLVQCINELSTEVEALKEEYEKPMSRSTTSVSSNIKDNCVLLQNTPNPFTERTEIRFSLPDDARDAYIYIFDMTGKMLRQIPVDSSMQSVAINGYELSAGIYLYSLVINGKEIDTKRMILSK